MAKKTSCLASPEPDEPSHGYVFGTSYSTGQTGCYIAFFAPATLTRLDAGLASNSTTSGLNGSFTTSGSTTTITDCTLGQPQ